MIRKIVCLIIIALLLLPIIDGGTERENEMIIGSRGAFLSSHFSFMSEFINNICSSLIPHPPTAIASVKTEGRKAIFRAYGGNQCRWDFDNDGTWDTQWINETEIEHVYEKPYNGFAKLQVKNEKGMDEKLVRVIAVMQEEDQRQDKVEDFVKIYGSKKYAQTFIPTMFNITGIKIYVARKGITSNDVPFLKILSKLFPNLFRNIFLGDLYIKIYEGKPSSNKLLTYVKLEPDDISKAGAWISIDFPKGLLISEWNSYCSIALEQSGGNERNYYKWYYANNNPYPNGSFCYYEGGRWREDSTKDFAFITYGKPTGDEPDGVEERWAVLIAGSDDITAPIDTDIMYNVLVDKGWDPSHIWTLYPEESTLTNVRNAIEQMRENEDMDDLCLVSWSCHGSFYGGEYYIRIKNYRLKGSQIDEWLNEFSCKGILILASSCHAGGAIYTMAQPNRVILASCAADKITGPMLLAGKVYGSWMHYFLADQTGACHRRLGFPPEDPVFGEKDGAFARSDPDTSDDYGGNNDGWISAEEGFEFYCKWINVALKEWPPERKPNPQIYDGYEGDFPVVRWRED